MPNHIHGILIIEKNKPYRSIVETGQCPVSTFDTGKFSNGRGFHNTGKGTISSIVGSYKSICTKTIKRYKADFAWQANFYDRVIRNEKELENIRKYIYDNPMNWRKDENFQE